MSAVESGDMEKADRMVHDAAMAAGYNLEAYQGTDVDFNEFKRRRHANGVTRINKYSEIGNVSAVKMESVIQ